MKSAFWLTLGFILMFLGGSYLYDEDGVIMFYATIAYFVGLWLVLAKPWKRRK